MTERFEITSGAARLVCDVTGHGPPIVCLHAGVADRRIWTATARHLAGQYRIYAYDRRGYGDTAYTPEVFSNVADLAAVIRATEADQVGLIGNSLGGGIALDYTLDNLDLVSALVLIAPAITGAPMPAGFSPRVEVIDALTEAADEAGDIEEVNRLEAHLWLDGPEGDEGRIGGEERALFFDMNGRALQAPDPGEEIESPSAWDRLEDLTVPTLMMVGDRDLRFYRSEAEAVVKRAANAQFTMLDDAAHLPMLERPDRFATTVQRFIDSI